jgi:hypothetical protein
MTKGRLIYLVLFAASLLALVFAMTKGGFGMSDGGGL